MVNLKGEPLVDFLDSSPSSPALSPPAPTYNPDSKANNNDDLHLITSQPCGPDRDPASLPPKILLPLPSLILTTLALSVSVFLVAMDVNVIATAIPHITTEFRSLNDIGWYGSAFLLTTCACQVPYGRVYTLFPAKWTFLSAIFLFMAGSLICALAPSSGIFILGRGVQGVGTSGILSGGLIIIAQVVPLHLRSILTGIIGAMEGIAMISAPVIGGALTDHLNWRWCFWVNLPIGGVVVLVVLFCLRMPEGEEGWKSAREEGETIWQTLRKLDLVGALALLPPVVCTILALHYAGNGYSWSSMNVILLFVLALVLFVIFGWTQHVNADVAMMPWRVVKQRSVMAAFWFILCISSALVVITYFLPLWFQTVRGEVATQAGIGILPMLVGVILGVLISGALVALIGYYTPFMLLSSALMPVGVGLLTTINPETSRGALIAYPAIFGLGVGLGFQQPLIGVQAVVAKADIPIGTSIVVFGQTFGAAIIIAVGESIFSNRLAANVVTYLGVTDIDMRHVLGDGQAGSSLASQLSPEQMPLLIRAVNDSLTQTFYLSVVMGILSLIGAGFMEWKNVKPPKAEKVATAEAGGVGAGEMREKF
ncbi:major facilitator superfamily domain-containing protein [Rhypophila decipiens]|uniref:Major facilitator superfamily domain-containing protein n=1 Tax=Rhypophila decipiens TaxID=261697 RepID=A0AAN7B745_9PEZI|nr:major facilitator superfamily domain-containing protein [Rhypophila decipiens]